MFSVLYSMQCVVLFNVQCAVQCAVCCTVQCTVCCGANCLMGDYVRNEHLLSRALRVNSVQCKNLNSAQCGLCSLECVVICLHCSVFHV